MTLVILGANPPTARAAATLDCDVIHVQLPDAEPLDPASRETSTVFTADFKDPLAFFPFVDEFIRPRSPAAIVSITEFGMEPAAVAAERLGVTGVASDVVRATRDKLKMREALECKAPHLNPLFARGDDPAAVSRLFADGAAVVAKPVDGGGSKDVILLGRPADLPPDRRSAATLLERFAGGLEFSVEGLSLNGRHTFVGIAEKGTSDRFVEMSHLMPPLSLDSRRQRLVERAVAELLDAIALTDGPSHTEVKVDGDEVVIIETHTRLGGDGIAELVELTTGVEWRRAAVGWAVGAGLRRRQATAAAAATVFITAPPGRVTAVAPQPVLTHGSIVQWDVTVQPGDEVPPILSSFDRLGMATLTAASPGECAAAIAEFRALTIVTTQAAD
ncbi:ATP-grasp domain-containing protein [Actinocrinis puniceicyclus]|uniref:ATP-grasp domain-containing protein n=1 Tax=Actinocrinis puniceicyclus TaxID=977794 RepID=A0A8J7WV77_9ACTN|nr:ATP-grasp domain-containing protein [Actinocrinis puniceicyclus]MBS2965779.1 ATP-grasp domain-containing protein [Actinocrinis puniceicyclus]